jgi:hypothetical protein
LTGNVLHEFYVEAEQISLLGEGKENFGAAARWGVTLGMDYLASDVVNSIGNVISKVSVCLVNWDLNLADDFPLRWSREKGSYLIV